MTVFIASIILLNYFIVDAFSANETQVFESEDSLLTDPPDANSKNQYLDPDGPDVQYILFQRDQQEPYNLLSNSLGDLRYSGFNIHFPTKIIIHDHVGDISQPEFTSIKNAYLHTGKYNVIGMDWSSLYLYRYHSTFAAAKKAAKTLEDFINWFIVEGVHLQDIHLIGNGVGVHIAALASSNIMVGKIGRITGLDPFTNETGAIHTLRRKDATLVDIINTNLKDFSQADHLGHLNFYLSCYNPLRYVDKEKNSKCAYGSAYRLFEHAILYPSAFRAYKCESVQKALVGNCPYLSTVYLGNAESYVPGIFYVKDM